MPLSTLALAINSSQFRRLGPTLGKEVFFAPQTFYPLIIGRPILKRLYYFLKPLGITTSTVAISTIKGRKLR